MTHLECMVESMFEETWLRLVIKQATGTGKTKVLSLLIDMVLLSQGISMKDSEPFKKFSSSFTKYNCIGQTKERH